MPALQKAEIDVKTEIQIPLRPNSGTNTVIYSSAPMPSTRNVPSSTRFTNRTMPDRVFRLKASCSSSRSPMPIRLWSRIITAEMMVMTPRPPIWIRSNITT